MTVTHSAIDAAWTGSGNTAADPRFVPGPGGCFYLSQELSGEPLTSPCVDVGAGQSADFGLDLRTTRSDEVEDTGVVDMGYHYSVTGRALLLGDRNQDERVDLSDISAFQRCFTGMGVQYVPPCCCIFDSLLDGDIDDADTSDLQLAITGP